MSVLDELKRIAKEPPVRLFLRFGLMCVPTSARTKALWDLASRPNYLVGVLAAADQARREGVSEIAVIEFGVAGGAGLLALEHCAGVVERETGIRIQVYGFDTGVGLPSMCGDYRDHPDHWMPSDYPMDAENLRSRLGSRTTLILGDARVTVPEFLRTRPVTVGFVAIDVDLYSSTLATLALFRDPRRRLLRKTYLYFDDVADPKATFFHRFAGELLAIDEFNADSPTVKIDAWRGLRSGRIFPEAGWIEKMYIAHDLAAISNARPVRAPLQLPL